MSNELTPKASIPTTHGIIAQNGKTNVNVTNQDGGIVNINYNFQNGLVADSAEQMMAVQSFSKKYYHLIVTCEEDVFKDNIVTVTASRALSQYLVPTEIFERCSSLSDEGIEELKTFPALICRENTGMKGETDPNQSAVYGYITKIKKEGPNIKVAFHPIGLIRQSVLCEKRYAIYFDLNMDCAITDLNHSAWSVHNANLFEAFKEAKITNLPTPV